MEKKHYHGHYDRLRQRFLAQGLDSFQDYEAPGTYRILVKVIGILGIDTSQLFEVNYYPLTAHSGRGARNGTTETVLYGSRT